MAADQKDLKKTIERLEAQNQELQARLEEAQEALHAITMGEVDALVVYNNEDERIYTLQGAEYAYRVMVESIHEGAASISADGVILYCNKRLAEMLEMPLEKVLGSSILNYLFQAEQRRFNELLQKGLEAHGKGEFSLVCQQGLPIPVLITAGSVEVNGVRGVCLVLTDLTEQKQAMAREKELQNQLMEGREEERVRIARNLHDGPLQDLLGLSYTVQAMRTPEMDQDIDAELSTIRDSVVKLAGELRNVCNELRPPNTVRFGLAKAIRYHAEDLHAKYPDLAIHLELTEDNQAIPKEVSTSLFRIYQECMNNIIRHANASTAHVQWYCIFGS